jgi:hypothetical protein
VKNMLEYVLAALFMVTIADIIVIKLMLRKMGV